MGMRRGMGIENGSKVGDEDGDVGRKSRDGERLAQGMRVQEREWEHVMEDSAVEVEGSNV